MLDIETLGTSHRAAIIQVAAIVFNENGWSEMANAEFDMVVNATSSIIRAGGEVTQDTIDWWKKHDPHALYKLCEESDGINHVFLKLKGFILEANNPLIWTYGAAWDLAVIEHARSTLGADKMWNYKQPRDVRTICKLAESNGWERPKCDYEEHDALHDCRYQVNCLLDALKHLGLKLEHD